jgi:hypothetical protein
MAQAKTAGTPVCDGSRTAVVEQLARAPALLTASGWHPALAACCAMACTRRASWLRYH